MRASSAAKAIESAGPAPKRCAVYARKSTEEGLDQEFNSIDAQREAGHAYILSQRHEGWTSIFDEYTDPGFSGGNMDRPGLKRLLADVEAGKIDIVVVYKIDRLTRSLTDFSRMIDVFDRRKVSFVSVTQQFNTTTSMGRLMLNVLLSFAQFEREITGERIRDKIAASKRKGLWMGGMPPLGYDVQERRLIVNKAEAAIVQKIFTGLVRHRSPTWVVKALNDEGITTKAWTTQSGRIRQGQRFTQAAVHNILRNRVYRGEIPHRGSWYPGEHPAIIDEALWHEVEAFLGIEPHRRGNESRAKVPFLLKGLLFDQEGHALSPWQSRKKSGKLYRYYISTREFKEHRGASGLPHYPADALEQLVIDQLQAILRTPSLVKRIAAQAQRFDPGFDEAQVSVALLDFAGSWGALQPVEQARVMRIVFDSITVLPDSLEMRLRKLALPELSREYLAQQEAVCA